jgi:hypothetical protein
MPKLLPAADLGVRLLLMQSRNPYEPPTASLDTATPSSSKSELQYATFWHRFGACLIDGLVLLPLIGIAFLSGEKTRLFY